MPNWLSGDPGDVDRYLQDWTRAAWGWTLPCQEVICVLSRVIPSDDFRIIDVGAGRGNWTRVLSEHFGRVRVVGIEPNTRDSLLHSMTFQDWLDENGPLLKQDIVFLSYPPCSGQEGSQLSVEVIDAMVSEQWLLYLGEGPRGAAATPEFHRRLFQEYTEWTTVPIPTESPFRLPAYSGAIRSPICMDASRIARTDVGVTGQADCSFVSGRFAQTLPSAGPDGIR